MDIMGKYHLIKGRITANDILSELQNRGLKATRNADYSIYIVRNVLGGRTKDENIEKVVDDFYTKLSKVNLV